MNSAELLELGTQPIRADAPAGGPGRETPEFEALQEELRKLEHPDQPNPDWKRVVASGTTLLKKSKDLMAASYLCIGLFETEGYPGLASGLTVVRDLIAGFWETLYPEKARLRGRAAAIEWLGERGAQRLRRAGARAADPAAIATCLERVHEIGELLAPQLDSGDSLLRELRDALSELEQEPEPAPAPAASSSSFASSSSAPAGPSSISSPADFDRAVAEVRRLLGMMGGHLRSTEPMHPLGYRAARFSAWMAVRQLPPNDGGRTQIPAPQPPDLLSRLEAQLAAGQWPGVLQETEDRITSSLFWLDLHRCAAQALEGMGEGHRAAADAIAEELRSLLGRFPTLPDLQFADGTPVANSATRQWIASRVLGAKSDAPAAAPEPVPVSGAPDEEFQNVRREARDLARKKRLPEALKMLEAGAARCGNLRQWVDWKLEVARLCIEQGHESTALAQLDAVDDRLRTSKIEDWDPAACVEVLKNLLSCRQKVLANRATPEDAARSRELMSRLTRLDVVAAVEMNGRH